MMRASGRLPDQLREVALERGVSRHAEGSCVVKFGHTQVLCTASIEEKVPPWMKGLGQGWVTAEYGMLPRSTGERMRREAASGKQSGRSLEIQRLIGRSLRAVVDLKALGERQILVDCDVIQADGGTRTAAITGGWVALHESVSWMLKRQMLKINPIRTTVAAVSCGIVGGRPVLDLDYLEDSGAGTDANFVLTGEGGIVEIQGTAEGAPVLGERLSRVAATGPEGDRRAGHASGESGRMNRAPPERVLESVVYADDLERAEAFYGGILGLARITKEAGRHVFFRCGSGTVLVFNPLATRTGSFDARLPVPGHGAEGPGHICFGADAVALDDWRQHLTGAGVAIEADFEWPWGGRSIYVRDPAGNSVEFAEPRIWHLDLTPPLPPDRTIVIATHNPGKFSEIKDLLRPHDIACLSAGELGLAEPEETGTTFAANAMLKARAAAQAAGRPALADDSGLSVDALKGEPGVLSARWAGPDRDFGRAMQEIERRLAAVGASEPQQRRAHFTCALCLAFPDGAAELHEGRVEGRLTWPPRGTRGFGYDPIFQPDGHEATFGEMDPDVKNAMSHRAKAFESLARKFKADQHAG